MARRQYQTKPDPVVEALTPEQGNAIDLLILGKSDREVSEAVGVCRTTLWTWRKEPLFLAELERRRRDIWSSQVERLRSLIGPALDVLSNDLTGTDPRAARFAAVQILRGCGMFGSILEPDGKTDPAAVAAQLRQEELMNLL